MVEELINLNKNSVRFTAGFTFMGYCVVFLKNIEEVVTYSNEGKCT